MHFIAGFPAASLKYSPKIVECRYLYLIKTISTAKSFYRVLCNEYSKIIN